MPRKRNKFIDYFNKPKKIIHNADYQIKFYPVIQ